MSPEITAAWIAAGVSILTLIGTVIAQIVGYRSTKANTEQQIRATHKDTADVLEQQREQLDKTLADQRTRTLNERFTTAAEQLGSEKPAVRLAGVYAMAGLADDWEANRQTCVDVLCAFLRMPYAPDLGPDAPEPQRLAFQASREVRHTVIRVITAHLRKDATTSWQGLNLDFTGVVFDGGDFVNARFSGGTVSFAGARFCGEVSFHGAEFSGGEISFKGAEFSSGTIEFDDAKFSSDWVYFGEARFSGAVVDFRFASFPAGRVFFVFAQFSDGTVNLGAEFSGGDVSFNSAVISGGTVDFGQATFTGGRVDFNFAKFSGGQVNFGSDFSGGNVTFGGAVFSGGRVDFDYARFSGGRVNFSTAEFSGSDVSFNHAQFSRRVRVDFSDPKEWSSPPAFPWTDTPPQGVKLSAKENQAEA
jgi:uncharacterized protein YjbI with pentapeptide repeats